MPLALAMNEPMISSSLCFLDYHDDGEVKKLSDWGSWEFFNCLLAYLDLSPCYHPMPTETESRGRNWAELSLSNS